MIEHVPEPMQTLRALSQLIRPGGWLVISTINRTLKAYLGTVLVAEYVLNWVPKGTHDYTRYETIRGCWVTSRRPRRESIEG